MSLKTKYGTATLDSKGYYRISSIKEGNEGKLLHRLIAADYFGDWINDSEEFFIIHHINGDKTDNCVLNLEPLTPSEHRTLHNKGNAFALGCNISEDHKKKISEALTGLKHSQESKGNMSNSRNTVGYYRVTKHKDKKYKQGFAWEYQYYENNTRRNITSTQLNKLEEKVKAKGLPWFKLSDSEVEA